jgi:hypothetical protein
MMRSWQLSRIRHFSEKKPAKDARCLREATGIAVETVSLGMVIWKSLIDTQQLKAG